MSDPRRTTKRAKMKPIELGCAGHFICAYACRWRRHTQVGPFRVSSVGDYYSERNGKRDRIGGGNDAFFETMVFKTTGMPEPNSEGCGCQAVANWSELDGTRYATAGEAQAGHERFVKKYLAKVNR